MTAPDVERLEKARDLAWKLLAQAPHVDIEESDACELAETVLMGFGVPMQTCARCYQVRPAAITRDVTPFRRMKVLMPRLYRQVMRGDSPALMIVCEFCVREGEV